MTSHPTASEVYDMVRKRLPRIGLGTVYRNLELMANSGIILKIEVGGTQKRFDATTTPHHHIRCTQCDRVDDITIDFKDDVNRLAAHSSKYQIFGHHIEFTGLCQHCSGSKRKETIN